MLNELGPDTENDIEEEGEPEVDGEDSWEEFEEDEDTVDQTAGNGNAMEQAWPHKLKIYTYTKFC